MIDHIAIENFRCFRKVEATLRPFTVLIGQNDTGKSSFLRSILCAANSDFRREELWRGKASPTIRARVRGSAIETGFERAIQGPIGLLKPTALFTLPAAGVAMTSQGEPARIPELTQLGTNLPALIDYYLRKDRRRFDAFVQHMRERVPGLEEINVETPNPASRQLELKTEGGFTVPGELVSAGVRLLLFFVGLAHHPALPKVILLEEPENGLHPKRLADVVRLLKGLTKGAMGAAPAQVILTTHSPLVLDEVNLDEDQVLVFRRESDGSRSVTPVDREGLKLFLDEFKLGEVWFNREEQGLVQT